MTLTEAGVLIADWMKEYNQVRPHGLPGYKKPAPEVNIWSYSVIKDKK